MRGSAFAARRPVQSPHQARSRMLSTRVYASTASSRQAHRVSVSVSVNYKCAFGQRMVLVGNDATLGDWLVDRALPLKWSSGDTWTCNMALAAGSSVECKYVVVDSMGHQVRWQEGSNMEIAVPASIQGMPVEQYAVQISWCKKYQTSSAVPLTTPAVVAASISSSLASSPVAVGAASSFSSSPAPSLPPVMAWALAKGAALANSVTAAVAPAVTMQPAKPAQPAQGSSYSEQPPARRSLAGAMQHAASSGASELPSQLASPAARSAAQRPQPPALGGTPAAQPPLASDSATASSAAAADAPAPSTPPRTMPRSSSTPAFSMTPASEHNPLSITLPPRTSSPPFKLSLSESMSRLMDLPASPPGSPRTSISGAAPASSASSTPTTAAKPAAARSIFSHPLHDLSSAVHSSAPAPAAAPAAAPAPRAAAAAPAPARPAAPAAPQWGQEYDMYASVYASPYSPYIHTPFDLDAYAVYEQPAHEAPAGTATAAAGGVAAAAGATGLLSSALAVGTDPLESAMQAARAGPITQAPPAAAAAAAAPLRVEAGISFGKPTAAAAAAPAPEAAAAAAPAACAAPAASSSSVSSYSARGAAAVGDWAGRTLFEMSSGAARSLDDDHCEEDESSLSRQQLLPSSAEEEDAMAAALAPPASASDMEALLKQLGSALGRSVRMRQTGGADTASTDLLELDRKVALFSSRLYRQRDNLLVGWVRKETRRQLAAAAVVAAAPARPPAAGSATPL